MVVAIAVTVQDGVWPPRNAVAVTGLSAGVDFVSVFRVVGGEATRVRSGTSDGLVSDSSFVVTDAEYPFGVPVFYRARVNAVDIYETAPATYTLPGGNVAITDAITGLSAEVRTLAWESRTRTRTSTRFRVSGRNVVVTGPLGQFESELSLFTETATAGANLLALLDAATGAIVQYRSAQSGTYSNDCYMVVDAFTESRWSQDGSDERRIWTLQVAEVDPWASELEASVYTLQDIYDFYGASATLADLAADHATLLDVATADWQ